MRAMMCSVLVVALGCTAPEGPLPVAAAPPAETWPAAPDGLAAGVQRCADDYRAAAREGLPPATEGEPFSAWYRGAFQAWTARYNDLRARCDEELAALDGASAAAQVLLATQSQLHARASRDAARYEEAEAQMFVLGRYWALGAACTYQACARGPDRAWAEHCARAARELPPCPPVEE
ncbi:MAG: hypothetical protein KF729_13645 [Sandaracinaceae bacterium]|nr:hypothetical protein [Sandaracinaceae bacterium]